MLHSDLGGSLSTVSLNDRIGEFDFDSDKNAAASETGVLPLAHAGGVEGIAMPGRREGLVPVPLGIYAVLDVTSY